MLILCVTAWLYGTLVVENVFYLLCFAEPLEKCPTNILRLVICGVFSISFFFNLCFVKVSESDRTPAVIKSSLLKHCLDDELPSDYTLVQILDGRSKLI